MVVFSSHAATSDGGDHLAAQADLSATVAEPPLEAAPAVELGACFDEAVAVAGVTYVSPTAHHEWAHTIAGPPEVVEQRTSEHVARHRLGCRGVRCRLEVGRQAGLDLWSRVLEATLDRH